MSVSKYIEEVSAKIEERVQKNLKEIEANPYPIDELEQLKKSSPDSALAKLFGPSGEIPGQSALQSPAMQQDPVLYKKLNSGAKALKKAQQNEKLKAIDIGLVLSSRYSAFIQGLATSGSLGSKLTLDEVLQAEPDEFDDTYGLLLDSAREGGGLQDSGIPDASASTLMSAFAELKTKGKVSAPATGSPINESATKPTTEEKAESAVNLPGQAGASPSGVEKVSSTVSGAEVKIPEEVVPPTEPLSINIETAPLPQRESQPTALAEKTAPTVVETSPVTINDNRASTAESISQTSTSVINVPATQTPTSSPVGSQTTISEKSESVSSQIERLAGQIFTDAGREISKSTREATTDLSKTINSKEEISSQTEKTKDSFKESVINSSEKGAAQILSGPKISSSELAYFQSILGSSLTSSIFSEKSDSTSSSSSTEKEKLETSVSSPISSDIKTEASFKEKSPVPDEKMGVTKDSPKFSERIQAAPKPMPVVEPQAAAPQAQAVAVTPVQTQPVTPTPVGPGPTSPGEGPSPSQGQPGMVELAQRMSRIEYLLSNTLEVKIVD